VSVDEWTDRLKAAAGGFSVRTKILGIVLALTTVLGLAITWQVRSVMSQVVTTELESRGHSEVSDLAARSVDPILLNDTYALFELLNDTATNHPDVVYGFVGTTEGAVLAHTFGDSGFPSSLLDFNMTLTGEVDRVAYNSDQGRIHDFATPIFDGTAGIARLGLSESRLQNAVDAMTGQMLLTTLFVGLLGVVAASLLTWLLTRPILELRDTTQRVGLGDLGARAELWADDEIGQLATAFNQMVADLEANRSTIAQNERARTKLLERLISAQEEERRRISRELHDSVGQALSSMIVGISVVSRLEDPVKIEAKVAELDQLGTETLQLVRQLSRELRPSALDDLGLGAALDRYAAEFSVQHPELAIDLHCNLTTRLSPAVETALYRIIQEAMTNVARHSQADTLSVLISRRDGLVHVIVEDNGSGFDPSLTRTNGFSVGIHAMEERAELLGGRFTVESGGSGTTVYIEVPA
jgi:signal transduction histidine kinase